MIKLKDILNEAMSDSEIKKMRDDYNKTGKLPPHLKKMLKGKKDFEKKFKVKNIVVPGLEWMSKIKEATKEESVNEAPEHELASKLDKVSNNIFQIMKRYEKKADVEGMVRAWMLGLHSRLKKSGVKI